MLDRLLRKEIQEKGPLTQSRFMELALQHPLYGYYRSQEAIAHDFITAPEISQVFGELIGAWVIDYYTKLKEPSRIDLVELGPGRGTLMADLLRIGERAPLFSQAIHLTLVEINPLLRAAQRKVLPPHATWVEHFEEVSLSSAPLVIIANEFLDALPTDYYVRKENVLYKRSIDFKENQFVFTLLPLSENYGRDESWEESPQADVLIKNICLRLLRQSGVFLCIDYGYEKGQGDSLQALYKGKPSPSLSHLGQSDLTCHVNFNRIKEISLSQGLKVLGPLPQGRFLKNLGLETRIGMLKHKNPFDKAALEAAAQRLSHPQQMGTLFKAMAVFSPSLPIPAGFEP